MRLAVTLRCALALPSLPVLTERALQACRPGSSLAHGGGGSHLLLGSLLGVAVLDRNVSRGQALEVGLRWW